MGRALCDTTFLWKALSAFIVKIFFLKPLGCIGEVSLYCAPQNLWFWKG